MKMLMIGLSILGLLVLGAAFWGMSELQRYERMSPQERAAEQARHEAHQREEARRNLTEHADGRHCVSRSTGQHADFVAYFREQLREPDSFEHIHTIIDPVDRRGQHHLMMRYRARNGFGGMNVGTIRAEIANSDCSFRVIAS